MEHYGGLGLRLGQGAGSLWGHLGLSPVASLLAYLGALAGGLEVGKGHLPISPVQGVEVS